MSFPVVIKEDGLAAGKGVVISETKAQTARAIDMMLDGANAEIVVEEFLDGEEASFFVLSDGDNILPLAGAAGPASAFTTAIRVRTRAAWAPIRPRP